MQCLQVEVQFPGAPMIQHINLIWGYKNLDRTFAPAFQDESQLPTFRVANCDAIREHSRTWYEAYLGNRVWSETCVLLFINHTNYCSVTQLSYTDIV